MDTLQTLSLLAKPILSRYDRCWFVDPAPMPLTFYDFALSGNCHKIRLMLSFLDLSYIKIPTSVKSGETRTPEFLQINPFGQVPVLVDQDCTIRDSLAILVYLVRKYANDQHWLPQSPAEMAQVLSWVAVGNVEVQNSIAQQWLATVVYLPSPILPVFPTLPLRVMPNSVWTNSAMCAAGLGIFNS
jgi:glutathione S-transferase